MSKCEKCGQERKLVRHHLNYENDEIIRVCFGCHMTIHRTNKYNELKPKDAFRKTFSKMSFSIPNEIGKKLNDYVNKKKINASVFIETLIKNDLKKGSKGVCGEIEKYCPWIKVVKGDE